MVPGTMAHAAPPPEPATVEAGVTPQSGATDSSKSNASWAYAHARWTWKSQGSTGKVKVYVNDQSCRDGKSAFAFMQFLRANGQLVTGETRWWNPNGECVGKGVTKTGPSFSDDFHVTHARVVVCKDDTLGDGDTCKKGNWKKNPYA